MNSGSAPEGTASTTVFPRPEILSPAGDWECARAAVENGADAIYFGASKHNARARATNFAIDEIPELLSFLRLRGVKGYLAFNTLIFSDELREAASMLERVIAAGPDALILQDMGVARLARAISPDVPLHASTQTTTTCAEQMPALRELGFSRVILARELSIKEIAAIRQATDMELEVFVHGALCVAYSGQCLTSEALGGRSANRGACAQACRLPYDLIVDGERRDLGERSYLISPQDLAAIDVVPELIRAGVHAFKIEGRLKSPEYVAATTAAYRRAVDSAGAAPSREERLALQQVFSRGLSRGYLSGINHQTLVPALSPKKRGPFLGEVRAVRGRSVELQLENPVKPGDGVVFDYGRPEEEEPGGRVYEVWKGRSRVSRADRPTVVELTFGPLDFDPIRPGVRVWKTDDPALNRQLRASFERASRKVPVDALVEGRAGIPMRLTLSDGSRRVIAESDRPLQRALNRPLDEPYVRNQLARMGGTPFALRSLEFRLEGPVILPVSRINELRRRAVEELETVRRRAPEYRIRQVGSRPPVPAPETTAHSSPARLVALCRSLDQVRAALDEGIREIECDFEDIRNYSEAVSIVRSSRGSILLAPPRIFKPGEGGILRSIRGAGADGVLVRSAAHLEPFSGQLRVGDFSLNIANELSASWLLSQGLDRFVPSFDLNFDQLSALLQKVPPERCEIVAHQHMPMFHNEHCVFAALLSDGTDSTNCGRPCDRHRIALKDRAGYSHPVKADVGCRNTVFNAVAQSASPYIRKLLDLGVRRFRVDLLEHSSEEARRLFRGYREVIDGRTDGSALWRELKASNVLGVTRGPLSINC
jgi:putative protease